MSLTRVQIATALLLTVGLLAAGGAVGYQAFAAEEKEPPAAAARPAAPALVITGWGTVINPDGDCKFEADKGRVTVSVPGTAHDFAGELKRWNAPRVMFGVKGDFILEVKVSGKFDPVAESTIEGRRSYNGGGILLVKDKDNHLSLQRGAVHLDDKVRHYANFELRRGAELDISLYEIELEDKDVYLRVERRGKKVYGMVSHDGVTWKSYDPIEVDFPASLEAGVEVINSAKAPFKCSFEGLSLFRKTNVGPAPR
jgi:regulation of enolase protein 1 (concanavalin A-like superfamily)